MSSEIKIRVKEIIKDKLVKVKEKTGLSINYQVNFAIFKYLILDTKVPFWEIDTRPDPHYDVVNKLPEELKFCDGDSCKVPFNEKSDRGVNGIMSSPIGNPPGETGDSGSNPDSDSKIRGDKC